MTCQELRLYFEDPLRMDAEFGIEAEHLARCAECARFVEARRELGAGLRCIRESLSQHSAALDTAILANYRRHVVSHSSGTNSAPGRRRVAVACWSAAAAVLTVAAALVFHQNQKNHTSAERVESTHVPTAQPAIPVKAATVVRSARETRPHFARGKRSVHSVAAVEGSVATDFHSLMYCDEISCGGAMQLIRVQLPSSAAPTAGPDSGTIYADVLVGPDGIARGIRIVQ